MKGPQIIGHFLRFIDFPRRVMSEQKLKMGKKRKFLDKLIFRAKSVGLDLALRSVSLKISKIIFSRQIVEVKQKRQQWLPCRV